MIFIPCKDGISHNEIEDAKPEHITAGCNVLLHAMLERAAMCRLRMDMTLSSRMDKDCETSEIAGITAHSQSPVMSSLRALQPSNTADASLMSPESPL
jgi:hypothetical protein